MTRTFQAIGQGAFYTEKFENGFTIVYDCGGQNKKFIADKIQEVFTENEKVDILFISHFHNDHINGVDFLIEYCDVKKVVLPFLHDNMKIQFIIENTKNRSYNQFIVNAIINPQDTFKEQELVFVEPFSINPNSTNINQYINSNKIISNYIDQWIYIPYNIYFDKFALQLEVALKSQSIDINNISDKIKTDKYNILNIYKSIIKESSFNTNSLIVYSGLSKDIDLKLQNITFVNSEVITSNKVGCLYLGDAELKVDEEMKKVKYLFTNYWDDISVVQIPHHGSYKNYHTELSWSGSISVISTGFRYSHPSQKVVEKIKSQDSICAIVSYDKSTQVIQQIPLEYVVEEFYPELAL